MSPDDLTHDEMEVHMAHYDAPAPDPKFVDSLGDRLQRELQARGAAEANVTPIDRSNRIIGFILAAAAACGLIVAGGVAAVAWWLVSGSTTQTVRESSAIAPSESQVAVDAESSSQTEANEQVVENAAVEPTTGGAPTGGGELPATSRPGMPVAEGLTGRPRIEPQADRKAIPETPRYTWKPGKQYAYSFSINAKIGDDNHQSSGRVSYQVSDPAREARVTTTIEQATGSGFVVTPDGHLVTCAHVVRGATNVEVRLNGETYTATIVGMDRRHDLALLRIDARGLTALSLGDDDTVELAQDVRVVGYPLTDVLGSTIKITRGTVAGFVNENEDRLFQIDAPINAGNSGGPVVNERGEVVGVASAKLSGEEISNVGFAVPVAEVQALLRTHGVSYQDAIGGGNLEGPELARRVTPAVAMLEVNIGTGGYGLEEQVLLTYDASMTTKQPASGRSSRGRGRFGPPPEMFMDPFSRMRAAMPKTERGKFHADVVGEVHDADMELNLPFLFGPAGLLAIEPMGEKGETKWYRQRTISIVRTEEERESGPPFGPFMHPRFRDPFGRDESRPKVLGVTSAFERYEYELGEATDETLNVKKRYSLKTLDDKADPKFNVTGDGSILFDREEGVPRSMSFDATFEVQTENVTLKIPVKFTYEQVDPASSPAGQPSARPAAVAARPQPSEPVDRTLKEGQIDDVLRKLASTEQRTLRPVLTQLSKATPGSRQGEIAQALETLLQHKDWPVRRMAADALVVWCVPENERALIAALRDSNFTVRGGAIKALAKLATAKGAEAIVAVYGDNHDAKGALIKMGPVAEEAVLTLVQHDHWVSRADACEILGKIGTEKSLTALQQAASESNGLVKTRANAALSEIAKRQTAESAPPPSAGTTAETAREPSPETVLRDFLVAMTMVDRPRATQFMLSGTDADVLWTATPPPPLAQAGIEQWIRQLGLRRLKPSDAVELPGGRQLIVTDRHVNEEKLMITWDDNPVPFILVKTPEGWRVDARTVVMARKAAAEKQQE